MKMDKQESKYNKVFDIIEHPDNYTPGQLAEIMSDTETREIYNLLCMTESAMDANKEINVEAEWENFSSKHSIRPSRRFMWFGSRAASIAALIVTSIAAVAAGIAVTVAVIDHKDEPMASNDMEIPVTSITIQSDSITAQTDSIKVNVAAVMFENEPLEVIMNQVANAYGVEIKFNNKETAALHLYYKLDTTLPLDEVLSQLNTFDQINIKRNDNTITID